ncbi:MAG: FHA domain-containing protein [Anaerolineae bacterium]|nr:FHA domain-containing protein [Anaerolineae bacterium]
MSGRFSRVLGGFICLLVCLTFSLRVMAQNDVRMVVNYAEVASESSSSQTVNIYFTLFNEQDKAIPNPGQTAAQLVLNGQTFTASKVGKPTTPFYIVLVLDTSNSMKANAPKLREAALAAVGAAPDGTNIGILRFSHQIQPPSGFTTDKNLLNNTIGGLTNEQFTGGTCLYDATFAAIDALKIAPAGRRAVILFTDGVDEDQFGNRPCSQATEDTVIKNAQESQNTPIYTIGLTGNAKTDFTTLNTMSGRTGGLASAGNPNELAFVFQEVINTLASQQQATFDTICLPNGSYSGALSVTISQPSSNASGVAGNINLGTDCFLPTATPTATETPNPTATSTPVPLTLSIVLNLDAAKNAMVFEVNREGDGDIGFYEVTIKDKATGILLPQPYGRRHFTPEQAAETIATSLTDVSADTWIVCIRALAADERTPISQEFCQETRPPRTPTPTNSPAPTETATPTPQPTATDTPTLTPTTAPTATATLSAVIPEIRFNPSTQEFEIQLNIANFRLEDISSYTVRIEDANKLVVRRVEQSGTLENPLKVRAIDDRTGQELAEGQYNIVVELNVNGQPTSFQAVKEIKKPAPPTPAPPPGIIDQIGGAIKESPIVAVIFALVVIAVFALIFFLMRRSRGSRFNYEPDYVKPQKPTPSRGGGAAAPESGKPIADIVDGGTQIEIPMESTTRDKGGSLKLTQSTSDQLGRTWNFTSSEMPYRIGRGGTGDFPVKVDLKDPGVSAVHATLQFSNGQYWIVDEGSTNGTFINGDRLKPAQRRLLEHGQTIRLGANIEFEFTDKNKLFQIMSSSQKIVPPPSLSNIPPVQAPPPPAAPTAAPVQAPPPPPPVAQPTNPPIDFSEEKTNVSRMGLPGGVKATLDVLAGNNIQAATYPILEAEFTIGRRRTNTLPLDRLGISREHCRIAWQNEERCFTIEDLGSGNGTFVNNQPLPSNVAQHLEAGKVYELQLAKDENAVMMRFQYVLPPAPVSYEDEPTQV